MRSNDIRDAYGAVKVPAELKEKLFRIAEEEDAVSKLSGLSGLSYTSELNAEADSETSVIITRKGGKAKRALGALCAIAAAVALVFAVRFTGTDDIEHPPIAETVVTTDTEPEPLPPDTAEVKIKVVDPNGVFVKNRRVDYYPVILAEDYDTGDIRSSRKFQPDREHADRAGVIPMTYDESTTVRIHYGTYLFYVTQALANDTLVCNAWTYDGITTTDIHHRGMSTLGGREQVITVDENTSEIVFTDYGETTTDGMGEGEIIIQDADGNPIPDCTVILQPKDGVYKEGYTDIYGGYVLHRTDENGSVMWKTPIEGEYTVIAYREKLHTADEPITDPVIIDGDDSYTFVENNSVFRTYKIFTEAKKNNQTYQTLKIPATNGKEVIGMKKKGITFTAALTSVIAAMFTSPAPSYALNDTDAAVTEATVTEAVVTEDTVTEAEVTEATEAETEKEKTDETEKAPEAEEEKQPEITDMGSFKLDKSGFAECADSNGIFYYRSALAESSVIFSADAKGNVLGSYAFPDYDRFNNRTPRIKALEDCVILTYPGSEHDYVVKLDKQLNEIIKCEIDKCRDFDCDGETIVIATKNAIKLCGLDGSNMQTVLTASEDIEEFTTVAISDKYIGFGGSEGEYPDIQYRTGVLERETGGVTVESSDKKIYSVTAFGDTLVWRPQTDYRNAEDKGEYYIYDGEMRYTYRTESPFESLAVDDKGNIITCRVMNDENILSVKVCRGGVVQSESFSLDGTEDSFYGIAANGGVIAVCTAQYPEKTDWEIAMYTRFISYDE